MMGGVLVVAMKNVGSLKAVPDGELKDHGFVPWSRPGDEPMVFEFTIGNSF